MLRLFQKKGLAVARPPLRLRNTLSGELERFEPLGRTVKMYNCGPTAYDYAHIGNLRSYVFADTLRRALLAWGYKVDQVINITDFGHLVSDADEGEDKMTKGLRREGLEVTMENMRTLAERYAEAFIRDIGELGVDTANIRFPRASQYVPQQISLIETLEQKSYAYSTHDGVYFDTARFHGYGKLGGVTPAAGAESRIGENKEKKSPHDFALWKKDGALGWQSPWGMGFPGWHIECTAMIFSLLGKQIDIHTGGVDHIAIHHNNEIAQAEAITGKQFVRYWIHNEFITIEGRRVGKSEGNAIPLSGLQERGISPKALRYWFLTGQYRGPMNFTWEAVEGAQTALRRLLQAYVSAPEGAADEAFLEKFYGRIAEDLDTPQALALVWENIKTLNKATLREADNVLGFGLADARESVSLAINAADLPAGIQSLIEAREAARAHKDFEKADQMRQEIESAGYELKDTPEGPSVSKK